MFEKEAEEYIKEHTFFDEEYGVQSLDVVSKTAFQDGAEYGYKLAHEEMDYLNQHWKSEEERKDNEWHYMKDVNCYEDLPQNEDVYYAYVVNVGAYDKPTIERKLGCFVEFEFDVMAYHVIAWKEIVLPELKENE